MIEFNRRVAQMSVCPRQFGIDVKRQATILLKWEIFHIPAVVADHVGRLIEAMLTDRILGR